MAYDHGDSIGLTEQNIAFVARRSMEWLANNSPELLEQKYWKMAADRYLKGKKMWKMALRAIIGRNS